MEFIGRSLRRTEGTPAEPLARLRALLDWRLAQLDRPNRSRVMRDELSAFGWWFASEKFDPEWALERLLRVLEVTGAAEPDHLVAEVLAKRADLPTANVLRAVQLMVENDRDGRSVLGWQEEARTILERAIAGANPELRARANTIIDALVARRFHDFRTVSR